MPRQISYKDLPAMMAAGQKGVKFAAARTLNDIAFDGLRKIPAQQELNFRRNPRQALGFRVNKARARRGQGVETIEAAVWTNRGWVAYHVKEDVRRAQQGWKYKGQNYILVPLKANKQMFFTNKGRLRAKFKRSLFIVPSSKGATVLFRGKRKKDTSVVGFLRREVEQHEDLNYVETMDKLFRDNIGKTFRKHLNSEIRRNFK